MKKSKFKEVKWFSYINTVSDRKRLDGSQVSLTLRQNSIMPSWWLPLMVTSSWAMSLVFPNDLSLMLFFFFPLVILLLTSMEEQTTASACAYHYVVVELLSHVWLFVTPWTAAHQASLSFTISQSLLKLLSIESVTPSDHLMFCRPLLLLPSVFSSIRVFSNGKGLHIR